MCQKGWALGPEMKRKTDHDGLGSQEDAVLRCDLISAAQIATAANIRESALAARGRLTMVAVRLSRRRTFKSSQRIKSPHYANSANIAKKGNLPSGDLSITRRESLWQGQPSVRTPWDEDQCSGAAKDGKVRVRALRILSTNRGEAVCCLNIRCSK